MIEPTDEMRDAFRAEREEWCDNIGCREDDCLNERLAAVLAIVERDYDVLLTEILELLDTEPNHKVRDYIRIAIQRHRGGPS